MRTLGLPRLHSSFASTQILRIALGLAPRLGLTRWSSGFGVTRTSAGWNARSVIAGWS